MHYQVDIHLSSVESPGTLKIHQVNLSRGTCFSSNFTPASLCCCNHTTMAAVCSMTLGKVRGDLRDVAGANFSLRVIIRWCYISPHSITCRSTYSGQHVNKKAVLFINRITFNQDFIWRLFEKISVYISRCQQCTLGWILTDFAHKYLWCSDIFRTSKERARAVNCVDYYSSQQNRYRLENILLFSLLVLIEYHTCLSEAQYIMIYA